MSEPRFGEWTATADRLPDRPGLMICEWPDGPDGPCIGKAYYRGGKSGWVAGYIASPAPTQWMPMPKAGETAGPGEATRKVLAVMATDGGGPWEPYDGAKGCRFCSAWWMDGKDAPSIPHFEGCPWTAALRECGMEMES